MRTRLGYERLTFFADAVVAIAITLLVLPLVDIPYEGSGSVGKLISEHGTEFFAFALSFVVIARLWVAHHGLSEYLDAYNPALRGITLLWLLTIIFLPFPTELLGRGASDFGIDLLYIGTLLVNTACLSGMTWMVVHRPELRREGVTDADLAQLDAGWWANTALLAVALVLALTIPGVGMYALLLLFLDPAITHVVYRRNHKVPAAE